MILSLIFFTIAAIANAIQQTAEHHFEKSIFTRWPKFFGPDQWKNKYRTAKYGQIYSAENNPYNRAFDLMYQEKFPFSATVLAFLTDSFHFFQFIRTTFIILAIVTFDFPLENTWTMIKVFVLYRCIYSGVFELLYSKLLIKK
jgi:hypothetical protein